MPQTHPQQEHPLGVSDEQIAKWKKQYKSIFYISIKGTEYGGYFRQVDMATIRLAQNEAKRNELDGALALYVNCKLKVSPEIEEDDMLKLSLIKDLQELVKTRDTEIKKL